MYCSYEDLIQQVRAEVLEKLAGDETGEIQMDIIHNGIQTAQSEIDAYCRKQFKVPFSPVPEMIRKIAIDIAIYNIASGRGFNFGSESNDRIIYVRYEKAIAFLEKVAAGKVDLIDESGGNGGLDEAGSYGTKNLRISSEKRIFGRSNMRGF